MVDYQYHGFPDCWLHPETLVVILDEHMPWELKPDTLALGKDVE